MVKKLSLPGGKEDAGRGMRCDVGRACYAASFCSRGSAPILYSMFAMMQ